MPRACTSSGRTSSAEPLAQIRGPTGAHEQGGVDRAVDPRDGLTNLVGQRPRSVAGEPVEAGLAPPTEHRIHRPPGERGVEPGEEGAGLEVVLRRRPRDVRPATDQPEAGRTPLGDPLVEQPARDPRDQAVVTARARQRAPLQRGQPHPRLVAGSQRPGAIIPREVVGAFQRAVGAPDVLEDVQQRARRRRGRRKPRGRSP